MINRRILQFCFVTIFLTTVSPILSNAQVARGGSDVGGGDEIGLEFQGLFIRALRNIRANNVSLANQVTALNPLTDLVNATIVVVDEPLFVTINGITQASVATNQRSTGTIRIHRQRWQSITNVRIKEGIALHEVLSLKGIESTGNYPVSSQYVSYYAFTTDSLVSGRLTYTSPSADQDAQVEAQRRRNCRERLRGVQSVINHFQTVARNLRAEALSKSSSYGLSGEQMTARHREAYSRIHTIDLIVGDLLAARNCMLETEQRRLIFRITDDASELQSLILARWIVQ